MDDRDYQIEAHGCVITEWDRGSRSTLVSHATGLGKTVLATRIVQTVLERGGRVLFVVHREELMFQAVKTFEKWTSATVAQIGAGINTFNRRPDAQVVVVMVQSVHKTIHRLDAERFTHVITDESHHAPAKSYRKIYDQFPTAYMLGLTATPKRADGKAMGQIYQSVAHEMSIQQGTEQGWLTPMRSIMRTCDDMDLRRVKTTAGDLNNTQLREQMEKAAVVDSICRGIIEEAGGRQTVLFCHTVEQSQACAQRLRQKGENAVHIDGKIPKHVRRGRMDSFADMRSRFLVNVGVCEEGVDVPGIEVVGCAKPTLSMGKKIQMVGRGLRPWSPPRGITPEMRRMEISLSGKPFCTVVDFVGQLGSKSLIVSGDLLGGEYDNDIRREAIEIARRINGEVDWVEIYKEATRVVLNRVTDESHVTDSGRRKEASWVFRYKPSVWKVLGLSRSDARKIEGTFSPMAADAARQFLVTARYPEDEIYSLTDYEQVFLARHEKRRKGEYFCTYPQAKLLHKLGYGVDIRKGAARPILDAAKAAGWLRPEEDGPNQVYIDDMRRRGVIIHPPTKEDPTRKTGPDAAHPLSTIQTDFFA